jgi:hypothetical protein
LNPDAPILARPLRARHIRPLDGQSDLTQSVVG